MIIGYTNEPIDPDHFVNMWDGKYEARILLRKDGEYSAHILLDKNTILPDFDFCTFAFSYKNDTSFPFMLKWDDNWIYCSMEGESLVSGFQVSALKDILSTLTYEGAKAVLKYLTTFNKQRWVIIDNGACSFSKDGWNIEGSCHYSNNDYKKKSVFVPSYARTEKEKEKEETCELQGIIFKKPGPGFKKYMKAGPYNVFVDDVMPYSPWHGKILPLDFVKSFNSIQAGVVLSDVISAININTIAVHRLPDIDPKQQPQTIFYSKQ